MGPAARAAQAQVWYLLLLLCTCTWPVETYRPLPRPLRLVVESYPHVPPAMSLTGSSRFAIGDAPYMRERHHLPPPRPLPAGAKTLWWFIRPRPLGNVIPSWLRRQVRRLVSGSPFLGGRLQSTPVVLQGAGGGNAASLGDGQGRVHQSEAKLLASTAPTRGPRVRAELSMWFLRVQMALSRWRWGWPRRHANGPQVTGAANVTQSEAASSPGPSPEYKVRRGAPWVRLRRWLWAREDLIRWTFHAPRRRGGQALGKIGFRKPRPQSVPGQRSLMDRIVTRLYGDKRKDIRVAILTYVFVEPEFRRRGLGEAFIREMEADLIRDGFEYVLLTVDDRGSGKLIAYYREMGFLEATELCTPDSYVMLRRIAK
jgi:GNAT superfamily N-acetyltransferase